jgi:hypothetical protein
MEKDERRGVQTADEGTESMKSPPSSRAPSPSLICGHRPGMLSCLYRGTEKEGSSSSEEEEVIETPISPPSYGLPPTDSARDAVMTAKSTPDGMETNGVFDTTELDPQSQAPMPKATLERSESKAVEDETTTPSVDEEDDLEEEEEEVEIEEDMVLRLGTGGRIGTLDVR